MRNLKLLQSLRIGDASELEGTQMISVDSCYNVVYCSTNKGLYGLDLATQEIKDQISLVEAGYMPADGNGHIVGIQHLPDESSVCVATQKGDLLLWNLTDNKIECVGSVDHGLTAMAWSSDSALVVLTTGQNTLIMMNSEFDPVTEVPMFSDEFGEAQFVNVGWGKKETQFHGSEGKHAAVQKKESVSPANKYDDRRTRICWHEDAQLFVVSALHPETGARQLRVWTRECIVYSTSESVDGIEQALGWRSSGNLITTCQRRPNKHDVVFFERNGLRHGEFTLPFGVQDVKVNELLWNRESNVLAVWLEDLPPPEGSTSWTPSSTVQIWTVGNYHWYLKQTLKFKAESADRVGALYWDEQQAYTLHIMCQGGQYLRYTWAWVIHHSRGAELQNLANQDTTRGVELRNITNQDKTNVAVIDGDQVLTTPFRQMVVPPPLSAYHLKLSSPVNQIVLAPPTLPNNIAAVTSDNEVAFFTFDDTDIPSNDLSPSVKIGAAGGNGFSVKCTAPILQGVYSITGDPTDTTYPLKFYHMAWVEKELLVCCALNLMGSQTEIYTMPIDHNTKELKISGSCELPGYIHNIAVSPDSGNIALLLTDGTLLKYDKESSTVSPWMTVTGEEIVYPTQHLCSRLEVTTIGEEEVVIGLSDLYTLYVNNVVVATNCTSYAIHDEYLLLTTYAHTCRCICRKTKVNALPTLSDGKAHPFDESIRRVERGSRVVCVVPDDTKVVLQMPRGNLETIHPRALVLSAVRKHLDRLQFKAAFVLIRKHRINMNLIHDHNPQVFLANVDKFVQQVEAPGLINQFLTDLQEEDVTMTMYTAAYNRLDHVDNHSPGSQGSGKKVDTVCDRIRETLQAMNSDKYLLSVLTAFVKKSVPELDTALKIVKELKGEQHEGAISAEEGAISAEEALKYLLFLVDVNELYDVALGTYDFDLVLMVAEKSQKDPKEYIPLLNSLRKMEENYQRFTIDKHLKRYNSALQNIVKCGETRFDECLELIRDQRLYREALKLYKINTDEYKEVAKAYGGFLLEKKHPEEAGFVFSNAEDWEAAVDAFEKCLNWRLGLCMACRAGYTGNKMEELCRNLAGRLKEQSRYSEAAVLYEQHLNDIEEAIVTLIEGSQWEESLRLMYRVSRTDFIETHFITSLLESQSQHIALVTSVQAEFLKHKNRLAVVRRQKEKARLEFLEGGGDHNAADADLFSDTSSATGESAISGRTGSQMSDGQKSSIFSKRSGRSAKNRRKQERKKWSLKEGNPYEDIALLEVLSKTCKQTEDWRGDVAAVLKMLALFHHQDEAKELQEKFEQLLSLVEKSIPDIWPDEEEEQTSTLPTLGPDSTANTIAMAMQQGRNIRPDIKIDPSLKMPPVLSKDNKWKLHSVSATDR